MTTTAVIQLTHCVDASLIARLFSRFRGRYGTLWTSRASNDEDWEFIIEDWLTELSKFSIDQVRAAVNKTLTEFKEYPPTLGQLVELCMKESGLPSMQEVIRLMIARDFNHPIVKMVYDKIGSWTLTNGKADEIERKVKEHYSSLRAEFHVEPQKAWSHLEEYNAKPKQLPPPDKIPSNEERKGFKERMAEYYQKLEELKVNVEGKTYREFDENAIKPKHKDFNQMIFNDYIDYLVSIPDSDIMILPPQYMFDRMRFIGMKEQPENLRKQGYVPPKERDTFASPKGSDRSGNGKPTRIYKNWTND